MGFYLRLIAYAALAALAFDFYTSYRKAEGSVWQKLLGAGKSSASILAARVSLMGGIALNGITDLSDMIGNPTIKALIDQYINAPAVGWTMVAVALVAEWARRRTLTVPVTGTAPQSFLGAVEK